MSTVLCSPAVAGFALSLIFYTSVTWGQNSATLEVHPSTIAVSPWYEGAAARVVLRNTGGKPLRKAVISYFTNDGFQVDLAHRSAASIEPAGAITARVRIKDLARARIPGSIQFEAQYTADDGTVQRAFAALSVTAQAEAHQKPLEVSVAGSFDAITDRHPAQGYLLVTNNLDVPINVTGVEILLPESIKKPATIAPFSLAPHSSAHKEFRFDAEERVRPGKYSAVFAVNAEWLMDGQQLKQKFVLTRDVSVGVFFESELLKVLGVPSFLLLPGCLFLFTMQLFLTLGIFGLKNDSSVPQLPVTSPGFWVLSITFSAVFALVYSLVTGTDYLSYYGVRDLTNVWLGSILLGAMAYLISAGIWAGRRKSRTPTAQDDPITALRRMDRNGIPIVTGVVTYKMNGLDLKSQVIEQIRDGQTLVWVAPKMVAQWNDGAQAQSALETAINERKSAGEIADMLADAVKQHQVSIRWASNGTVPNPYHLKVESITAYQAPDVILDVT